MTLASTTQTITVLCIITITAVAFWIIYLIWQHCFRYDPLRSDDDLNQHSPPDALENCPEESSSSLFLERTDWQRGLPLGNAMHQHFLNVDPLLKFDQSVVSSGLPPLSSTTTSSSTTTTQPYSPSIAVSFTDCEAASQPQLGLPCRLPTAISLLEQEEKPVLEDVGRLLQLRESGAPLEDDDSIFDQFTKYIDTSLKRGTAYRAAAMWDQHIFPLTEKRELEIGERLHKGAPLYNVGICHLAMGAFDRAYQFIAEAGEEDVRSGRNQQNTIILGCGLAHHSLISPLLKQLHVWGTTYASITTVSLDKNELEKLVNWLAKRRADALQLIVALHRLSIAQDGPQNEASKHLAIQALADLVVLVESSLKRWQTGITGELFKRMHNTQGGQGLCDANQQMQNAFKAFEGAFCAEIQNNISGWKLTSHSVNWAITECDQRMSLAASPKECAGICCWLIVKLRNTLMHVIDENIAVRSNAALRNKVVSWVLSTIRLSQHGDEGTLSNI